MKKLNVDNQLIKKNPGLRRLIKYLIDRGVLKSKKIIEAFASVDRKYFIPMEYQELAYVDIPIPISNNATTSQPSIIAYILENLDLKPTHKVLEIGSGSGYVLALLSKIVKEVYGVEIDKELYERSKKILESLGINNVIIINKDGSEGLIEYMPYDRILVSATFPEIPFHLTNQLKEKGIIITPVGDLYNQSLYKIIKNKDKIEVIKLIDCVFVPMKGKYGFKL